VSFDVIVVGLGAMGAAACAHLAGRGARVLGLDRFSIPNDRGSSHGDSRVIRRCYYEHPDYVPLLRRAYALWRELEGTAETPLLRVTGGVYTGAPDCAFIVDTLAAARAHDLPHERLSRADLRDRYPQFTVPDDHVAIFEPDAGYVLAEAAVSACAVQAMQGGAVLRGHEPVLDWSASAGGVEVTTSRGTYAADRLVLCAGPWLGRLIAERGTCLSVTRQVLAWVWPPRPERFGADVFPVFGIDDPDGEVYYGFPMGHGRPGFKIARHHVGPPADPDRVDRDVHVDDERDVRAALARYLPDANGPLLSMAVCMYTSTPDGHFVIDRHPEHERVVVAGGFSGHGFKFASVVGETLADLALDGATANPVGFLSFDRF
jgi:sarcosine oxidase